MLFWAGHLRTPGWTPRAGDAQEMLPIHALPVIGIGETKKRDGVGPDPYLMTHHLKHPDNHCHERVGCSVLESETGIGNAPVERKGQS